jgi:hypothetical protein
VKAGNFSGFGAIYDRNHPADILGTYVRTPFPNNQIPFEPV